jgi:hypothetical protein
LSIWNCDLDPENDAVTPKPPQPEPHPLEYAPRPPWHRRRRLRRIVVLLLLIGIASLGYVQRARLKQYWSDARLAWVQWRCLTFQADPAKIAYAEGTAAVQQFAASADYRTLPDGSVGFKCAPWEALYATLGRRTYLWASEGVGGIAFLHERYTPSGQRLLVRASYAPLPHSPNKRVLMILLLDVPSMTTPAELRGGLLCDDPDFLLGQVVSPDPNPPPRSLRIFCGQPDPSDRTRFWIDFELNGMRDRAVFRILDPDPNSTVPTWAHVLRVIP